MCKYGLIGKKLTHNKLPVVNQILCNSLQIEQDYKIIECENEQDAADVIRNALNCGYKGLNVAAPYQSIAYQLSDNLSLEAQKTGVVNTLTFEQGLIKGDNTEYYGIAYALSRTGMDFSEKKVLTAGYGAPLNTVISVLSDINVSQITIVTKDKKRLKNRYSSCTVMDEDELTDCKDVSLFLNCTTTGMFPDTGSCPVECDLIERFDSVIDLLYYPWETTLLKKARRNGKYTQNGMISTVAQAVKSQEIWNKISIDPELIDDIYYQMKRQAGDNIILIGMPGSGKTSVGKALAKSLSWEFVDTDEYIENYFGQISVLFDIGESYFREIETNALKLLMNANGLVLSTGGGIITRKENIPLLKNSGKIFFLDRSPDLLLQNTDLQKRPLLVGDDGSKKIMALYDQRIETYRKTADFIIDNNQGIFQAVQAVKSRLI